MNVRTYEILARWIASSYNVTIEWDNLHSVPKADIKNRKIVLPTGVDERNTYAALTMLMHEAAHINYTSQIPEDITTDQLSHDILNVIEDVRIDRKNFQKLPNIHEFYRRGLNYQIEKHAKIDMSTVPMHHKILVNALLDLENLQEGIIKDPEAEKLRKKLGINQLIEDGVSQIERGQWKELKKTIEQLMRVLELDKLPKQPISNHGHVGGKGDGKGTKQRAGGKPQSGEGNQPADGSGTIGDLGKDDGVFSNGTGQGHQSSSGNAVLGQVAMEEITKNKFKELLDIKGTKRLEEGNEIRTDQLTSFLTGDIDMLFEEHVTERRKRSKILFVMDSSGSMSAGLLDGKSRKYVVSGCVDILTRILDEVYAMEGINVDYEVAAFDDKYHPMSKSNWRSEYGCHGGGTDLISAYMTAQKKMLEDQEVDGNKMIIFFTDGDVSPSEIDQMRSEIIRNGSDIRVMVIGVGADVTSRIVDQIVGDNNILAAESSDLILMESIMTMLD